MPELLTIIIDGKEIKAKGSKTVLEVAREEGIYIPTLCTHKFLSPFGACRICLVEVEGVKNRLLTSCTTRVEDGMVVKTNTERVQKARRQNLEFMLSEHPSACLLCPYQEECFGVQKCNVKLGVTVGCRFCPKDEMCELQQVVRWMGIKEISIPSIYRGFAVEKDDPFFERDYNLCILCGRCVRICQDVRLTGTLTFIRRGPFTKVGTLFDLSHIEAGCEFCGSCVDACPTGALSERTRKWKGAPERVIENICPFCSMNCEILMDEKKGEVFAVRSRENLICSSGKFGLTGMILAGERAKNPLSGGREVLWEEALEKAAELIGSAGDGGAGILISPSLSCETIVAAKLFAEIAGIKKISSPSLRWMESPHGLISRKISSLKSYNLIIVTAPLPAPLEIEVKRRCAEGALVYEFLPQETFLTRHSTGSWRCVPDETLVFLLLAKAYENTGKKFPEDVENLLPELTLDELLKYCGISEKEMEDLLAEIEKSKKKAIIYTHINVYPPLAQKIAELLNLDPIPLLHQGNERGVFQILEDGVPFDSFILDGELKVVYSIGENCGLKDKKVIFQNPFSPSKNTLYEVFLPSLSFGEEEGTFIDLSGRAKRISTFSKPSFQVLSDIQIMEEILKRMGKNIPLRENVRKNIKKFLKERKMRVKGKANEGYRYSLPRLKNESFYIFPKIFLNFYRGFELHSNLRGFKRIIDSDGIYINPSTLQKLELKSGEKVKFRLGNEVRERIIFEKKDMREDAVLLLPSPEELGEIYLMRAKNQIPQGRIER